MWTREKKKNSFKLDAKKIPPKRPKPKELKDVLFSSYKSPIQIQTHERQWEHFCYYYTQWFTFSWTKVSHIHLTGYFFLYISLKSVIYLYIEQKWYLTSDNNHQMYLFGTMGNHTSTFKTTECLSDLLVHCKRYFFSLVQTQNVFHLFI